MASPITRHYRNADFVIAWDGENERHVYLRDADVVSEGNRLSHVGKGWTGTAHEVVDCRGRMLMPGLVNIHGHPSSTLEGSGFIEEVSNQVMGSTLMHDYYKLLNLPPAYKQANLRAALCELLKGGTTTVLDLSYAPSTDTYPAVEGWIETLAESGLRAYAGAQVVDALHTTPNGHTPEWRWNTQGGQRGLQEALTIVDEAEKHPSGRLHGLLAPGQVDTCTAELIQELKAEADKRNMPVSTHASQSVVEFKEMIQRHGRTPVEWLHDIGFLGPRTILGHCLFIDDHPWLHWAHHNDRRILAETGTTVAHCPWVQANSGRVMHSFASYLAAGINVGIGTDASPMNMIDEMRWTVIGCRVAEGVKQATTTGQVLHAATVNGAKALGRDDIGRLSPGCKADILSIDLNHPLMRPVRDPLRTLIFSGVERPLRDVWVDGRQVVSDGEVVTIDHAAALAELAPGIQEMVPLMAKKDIHGRGVDEAFPMSLEVRA
ncbi:MAG: amidohydrolase family protein [Alphaproteobacteria bacterium]